MLKTGAGETPLEGSAMRNLFFAAILAALFLAGCTQYGQTGAPTAAVSTPTPGASTPTPQATAAATGGITTVEITATAFVPSNVTIKAGDAVVFVNRDSSPHWPASGPHPAHTAYPETGGCIGSTFDACKGLGPGEEFRFTFNQKGSWKYHDHLNAATHGYGTINVE